MSPRLFQQDPKIKNALLYSSVHAVDVMSTILYEVEKKRRRGRSEGGLILIYMDDVSSQFHQLGLMKATCAVVGDNSMLLEITPSLLHNHGSCLLSLVCCYVTLYVTHTLSFKMHPPSNLPMPIILTWSHCGQSES